MNYFSLLHINIFSKLPKSWSLSVILLIYFICSIFGIYIWSFIYIPNVLSCENDCLYTLARHMFYFNQIVITMFGFILAHLLFSRNVSFLVLCATFGLATIFTHFNLFHTLNDFLVKYDLYPFWFKTSDDGKNVVSFQYARVYLLFFIMGGFYAAMCRKQFRTFDRIVWAWTFAALCIFSFSMHRVVGRMAFSDYQSELNAKIERVLSSNGGLKSWSCVQEGFYCYTLEKDDMFSGSTPREKNKLWADKDSSNEIDMQMNKRVIGALKDMDVGVPIVVSESELGQNNTIRSVAFGGINLSNGKRFVLIDYDRTAKALDIYLVFFTMLMIGFLIIWGGGIYSLKSFHASRGIT